MLTCIAEIRAPVLALHFYISFAAPLCLLFIARNNEGASGREREMLTATPTLPLEDKKFGLDPRVKPLPHTPDVHPWIELRASAEAHSSWDSNPCKVSPTAAFSQSSDLQNLSEAESLPLQTQLFPWSHCLSLIPLLQPEAGMHQCTGSLWIFHLSMAGVLQPAGETSVIVRELLSAWKCFLSCFFFHVFCECYSTVNLPSLCLLINRACNIYDKHYYRFLNKTHYATPVPHQSSCQ